MKHSLHSIFIFKLFFISFIFISSFSILLSEFCSAQNPDIKRTYHWYFGKGAGIDFSSGTPVADTNSNTQTVRETAVMSDTAGNLLFYVAGQIQYPQGNGLIMSAFNRNHNLMQNGDNLLTNPWVEPINGTVIIPKPGTDNLYYIFSVDAAQNNYQDGLRYSVVDMNMDSGFGAVIEKRKLIYNPVNEILAAIKHSNNIDYWVLTHDLDVNNFLAFLVTSSGIDTVPVITTIGTFSQYNNYNTHDLGLNTRFSPNGKKLAVDICWDFESTNIDDTLELYDFNKSTGILSNKISIPCDTAIYALSFSPDNSKLYIETGYYLGYVYQYDITSNNPDSILNSKIKILTITQPSDACNDYQIGPDGKIYLEAELSNYLKIIHNPNASGLACNYENNAFYLGGKEATWGLVNIIQSFYDKDSINNISNISESNNDIKIYPNPADGIFTIAFSDKLTNNEADIAIYDILGGKIKDFSFFLNKNKLILDKENLTEGIYLIKIQIQNKITTKKIMIIN